MTPWFLRGNVRRGLLGLRWRLHHNTLLATQRHHHGTRWQQDSPPKARYTEADGHRTYLQRPRRPTCAVPSRRASTQLSPRPSSRRVSNHRQVVYAPPRRSSWTRNGQTETYNHHERGNLRHHHHVRERGNLQAAPHRQAPRARQGSALSPSKLASSTKGTTSVQSNAYDRPGQTTK